MTKSELRRELRARRRAHAASLPAQVRVLVLRRPPRAVAEVVAPGAVVGVYAEITGEAPASGYARWFHEAGHPVALPWFADRNAAMRFRFWANPFDDGELAVGPWGIRQPAPDVPLAEPAVLFVPLVGFTASGARLGMGAGHYDRWLAAHPGVVAIGLGWDCQEVSALPLEPHDRMLNAVVTPTRLLGALA